MTNEFKTNLIEEVRRALADKHMANFYRDARNLYDEYGYRSAKLILQWQLSLVEEFISEDNFNSEEHIDFE